MRAPRTVTRRLVVAAAISTAIVGIVASPSFAQPNAGVGSPLPLGEDINDADLPHEWLESMESRAPLASGGALVGPQAAMVHPRGCYGQTDNPHKSSVNASVHGRTACPSGVNVSDLYVETSLYRVDWWGNNHMATDTSYKSFGSNSEDAHPHSNCDNAPMRKYLGASNHSIKDGATYVGSTATYNSFSCQ